MRVITAIAVSILIHGLLAVGLVAYFEYAPRPDVLATLDLSSVELSFAEQVEENAAVAALPATVGHIRRPQVVSQSEVARAVRVPSPPQEEKPPEVKIEKPLPPEAGEIKFPEPREDARLKTEDVVKKVPPKDNRTIEQSEQSNNSPPVAPRQARLDAPPKPKRNIRPDYPKGARQRGEQGDVVLEIRVSAEGTVDDVKVATSSGFAELDEAAVKAARAAKFSPARSGHDPVASMARLTLSFKLR